MFLMDLVELKEGKGVRSRGCELNRQVFLMDLVELKAGLPFS